jgi:hypothetical protein
MARTRKLNHNGRGVIDSISPRSMLSIYRSLLLTLCCSLLGSCQNSPLAPYYDLPQWQFKTLQSEPFLHQVIENKALTDNDGNSRRILHVYLEGDGRPWWTRYEVALDPTPSRLIMPELMTLDDSPALFLGRPCYFALADPVCRTEWWTQARYGQTIVSSLNQVLDRYSQQYDALRIFGHSGGGTLAMLIASTRNDVDAVITLAGNLDINAWTTHHNYSPLKDSLNPIDFPLSPKIKQWHYAGRNDNAVPDWLIRQSVVENTNTQVVVIDGIDHRCCWKYHWPNILKSLADQF